jgi:hypothetical protein
MTGRILPFAPLLAARPERRVGLGRLAAAGGP